MSTLLWTCPQNHGHVDGLNVGSISCYFILQITYLGVYKCILCPCMMFLHTPHMFFRLQPVCSVSLCSVGVANVDVFLSKCALQKWPEIARVCSYKHKSRVKLKLAISSFYCFFFTSIGYLDQKLWCFKQDTSHSIKNHFYVFFQNAHHCNSRKNAVFKNFWGFVSEYVGTITYVYVFIKSWFLSWSSLRTPVFLKLDRCMLTAVM